MWSNTFVDSTKAHGDSPLGLPDEILFRDIYRTQEILVPGFRLAFCIRMRHYIKLVRIGQKTQHQPIISIDADSTSTSHQAPYHQETQYVPQRTASSITLHMG